MSFPQSPCYHYRPGAPPVCTSCAMIRNMGGNDPSSGPGQIDAVTQRYRQHPNTARQTRQDLNRLYQQRPTPDITYGVDRTIADNIIGSEARPQLQDYPYPTQIDDSDLVETGPAVYQPVHPQRRQTGQGYRSPPSYSPWLNQANGVNNNRTPMSNGQSPQPQNYQLSPYQPNGMSTNRTPMSNGASPQPQSSRRQQPSAEYYQPRSRPLQDGPACSYQGRSPSMTQNSAVNGYVDEYYDDSSDEERERQRRRRRRGRR